MSTDLSPAELDRLDAAYRALGHYRIRSPREFSQADPDTLQRLDPAIRELVALWYRKSIEMGRVHVPMLKRLRQVREAKFLSQHELSERSHVSRVTITRLESGEVDARYGTIRKLAAALGVEPGDLVGEQSETHPA